MKKVFALLLTLILVASCATVSFAAEEITSTESSATFEVTSVVTLNDGTMVYEYSDGSSVIAYPEVVGASPVQARASTTRQVSKGVVFKNNLGVQVGTATVTFHFVMDYGKYVSCYTIDVNHSMSGGWSLSWTKSDTGRGSTCTATVAFTMRNSYGGTGKHNTSVTYSMWDYVV